MANSGARRKSANVHKLQGTYRKDRHEGKNSLEFEPEAPEAPDTLSDKARWVWDKLVPKLESKQSIALADEFVLVVFCELYAEYISDPVEFKATKLAQLRMFMCELGITPAARSKIMVPPKDDKPSNPFADL